MPTLLQSPLPQEILSPQITLHLFPSTHPHLPTVSGRVAYTAALWTAPVAWGRVPLVGNVKLQVLSERISKSMHGDSRGESLIVRWRTCERAGNSAQASPRAGEVDKIHKQDRSKEFYGLFIFDFDDKGRILRHTIEHADENSNQEHASKVISVTEWLLKKARGGRENGAEGLALGYETVEKVPGIRKQRSDCVGGSRRYAGG